MARVANEEVLRRIRVKEAAQSISNNLNDLEDICSNYSTLPSVHFLRCYCTGAGYARLERCSEQKEEKMTQIGLLVGKTMSTFCTLCDYLGIYDEDSIYGNVNKES